MRLKVLYKAIDPYYSDQVQTFIGITEDECWNQKYKFEEWLGKEHPCGIMFIYKTQILEEPNSIRL